MYQQLVGSGEFSSYICILHSIDLRCWFFLQCSANYNTNFDMLYPQITILLDHHINLCPKFKKLRILNV